ncbi:MAG: diguanylate cyclase [Thermoleophilia bacterium]|nr:diguanylate cyclase [Thermoleophilia bacterium]
MPDRPLVDDLRREALDAARGLFEGEQALVSALAGISEERSRAAEAYGAIVRSLAAALSAREGYTGEHSNTVRDLAIPVGSAMGLEGRALAEVEAGALVHDVGKIGIPDAILHKPGPLDDAEWDLMREHPAIGERILRQLPGLAEVALAERQKHERWDGNGYPDGLAGEAIPLTSRIVLACDAYNALVSDRPYRGRLTRAEALRELDRCAGSQFDPTVVATLLDHLGDQGGTRPATIDPDLSDLLAPPESDGDARRLERELHALITIASAVATVDNLDDLVEIAADDARTPVGADTLSVSRWEAQARVLRVIVNTGDLAPWEVRRPLDEVYTIEDDDALRVLLLEGKLYTTSLDDTEAFETELALLRQIGKHSCVAVPIMLGGSAWGELWAARGSDVPAFGPRDVRFLETIAGQIAAAVGRTELYARMADLAFKDPLTGVGNRRALEERLGLCCREAHDVDGDVAVLLADLDNLKELNDSLRHARGDQALATVAQALTAETAGAGDDRTVYRLGGDEFCLLFGTGMAEEARLAAERAIRISHSACLSSPPPLESRHSDSERSALRTFSVRPIMLSTSRNGRVATGCASPTRSRTPSGTDSREARERERGGRSARTAPPSNRHSFGQRSRSWMARWLLLDLASDSRPSFPRSATRSMPPGRRSHFSRRGSR